MIRYADDFVILPEDWATLLKLKEQAERWLATMGLNLKPPSPASPTRFTTRQETWRLTPWASRCASSP
jgi:hypothetical protein